jgi:hypothetical protein
VVAREGTLEIGSQVVLLDRWIGSQYRSPGGKKSTPEKDSNTSAISQGNLRGNRMGLMLFYSRVLCLGKVILQ